MNKGKLAAVNGLEMYYEIHGEGEPLNPAARERRRDRDVRRGIAAAGGRLQGHRRGSTGTWPHSRHARAIGKVRQESRVAGTTTGIGVEPQ